MKKELLKGLTDEQIEKASHCKSPEELLSLAKEEGIELTDEQLEAVSGGFCTVFHKCPKCGSKKVKEWYEDTPGMGDDMVDHHLQCKECGYHWLDDGM
jgi:DNA-directed RNA polymerase subunit M/transcription elongation factor TFIIS